MTEETRGQLDKSESRLKATLPTVSPNLPTVGEAAYARWLSLLQEQGLIQDIANRLTLEPSQENDAKFLRGDAPSPTVLKQKLVLEVVRRLGGTPTLEELHRAEDLATMNVSSLLSAVQGLVSGGALVRLAPSSSGGVYRYAPSRLWQYPWFWWSTLYTAATVGLICAILLL